MARIDVVIVSYNSRGLLRRSVEPLSRDPQIAVHVVDNDSQDGSLDVIADLPVQLHPLSTNKGFGHGCNTGWRAGSAGYVLFLNPDAAITPDAVGMLADVLDANPKCAVVGPKILEEDGSLDFSIRRFPRLRSTFAQALFLHRLLPRASWTDELVRDPNVYESSREVEWVSGACMLFRRTVLDDLDGFDEGFFLYSEDKDICRRSWDAGWTVRFEPAAVAVHAGGASAPRASLLHVLVESRVRYARKHRSPRLAAVEQLGIALGELTHLIAGRGGRPARTGRAKALRAAADLRRT